MFRADSPQSIFGMSMFDWQAKDGDTVVSRKIWIYIVVAVVLTCLVLIIWILWFKWAQKKYDRVLGDDIETADSQDSK
jgi:flagellar basal body-associated protein FliL